MRGSKVASEEQIRDHRYETVTAPVDLYYLRRISSNPTRVLRGGNGFRIKIRR